MVQREARLMGEMADYYDDRTEDFTAESAVPGTYSRRTYTNAERRKNAQAARKRKEVALTSEQIRSALALNENLQQQLVQQHAELQAQLVKARPAEPSAGHDRYSVQVQFGP